MIESRGHRGSDAVGRLRRSAAGPGALLALLGGLAGPRAPAAEAPAPRPELVTPQIELAVGRGLGWLVKSQEADGSWSAQAGTYSVAMTALAGIALLGSGSTATRGPFSPAIRQAEAYLLSSSDGSTGIFQSGWEQRPMYGHAFSMMFLGQLLGQEESLERRTEIRNALRRAITLTLRAQTRNGGWYYQPNAYQEEGTLTVTMMQGLRACRDAGIHVPKEAIDRGVRFVESCANADGGVRYRLDSSMVRQGTTCAAIVALWSAGRYDDPLLRRIVGYVDRNFRAGWGETYRTRANQHATYGQYYLGQARFLLGGPRWDQYYRSESALLVGNQEPDGSWITEEEISQHGVGAIYPTAVALILLQLPYNRLPIFER